MEQFKSLRYIWDNSMQTKMEMNLNVSFSHLYLISNPLKITKKMCYPIYELPSLIRGKQLVYVSN